ncbi:flagellar biosynthesis protein FlhB [Colidextribacter sp. OB.20]|uniref:flagellar biosynthesis protein FlhB n=1 Tax=Colidextribacter sp. OB.20 TaxID=2304568 RepID=UPI00136E0C0A|nr:flagellar biosynthesis protein FlhB [Colidextribacter sp. OB.20]NBI10002.1 flagellar biosynthesis protein FlhB [Colidextribacter sp. OB.20]
MAGESKTEKATPKKRRDERKKGNVMMSKDAVAVVTLVGSLFMVQMMGGVLLERLQLLLSLCFSYMGPGSLSTFPGVLNELFKTVAVTFAVMAGPFLAVTCVLAIGATFFQTKMLVAGDSIKPKFSRLNPLQGLKRLFSLRSVIEAFKSILKITILLVLIFNYFKKEAQGFSRFLDMELWQSCSILFKESIGLVVQISIAFAALAFFDYLYQWWDYERQLKMSKQEIKEEYKQTEGDPQVKGKIKQIQRQRAQQRMMQQVPEADVVIRNPTHFAVALRYKPDKDSAPVVVAKGMDELALRIVKVAEEHGISTVENVPLAHALYDSTELDREIPPDLYGPVAEILVYVLKLDREVN